tara:strand:+ start:157 stop:477 length:321 start_codon:yes stop_codon:yes gene_type:complete
MANGDITKEIVYDRIEVVNSFNIQIRKATKIMEEGSDGSKTELSCNFHRHCLQPYSNSVKNEDGSWTHTDTDISGEIATVQAIATAAWTDDAKAAYAAIRESDKIT